MFDSIVPHELCKLHRNKLWPIVRDQVFWQSVTQEHGTEFLNDFGRSGRWHNYDFWPFGIGIDCQKEHVTEEWTC